MSLGSSNNPAAGNKISGDIENISSNSLGVDSAAPKSGVDMLRAAMLQRRLNSQKTSRPYVPGVLPVPLTPSAGATLTPSRVIVPKPVVAPMPMAVHAAHSSGLPAALPPASPSGFRPITQEAIVQGAVVNTAPVVLVPMSTDAFFVPSAVHPKPLNKELDKGQNSLKLQMQHHALLCLPTGYMDCQNPIRLMTPDCLDKPKSLYLFRKTGYVKAIGADKQEITHGFASFYDAPYQGFWSKTRQLQIELEDENGQTAWWSVFGAWRMKNEDRTGSLLLEGELVQMGTKIFITSAKEYPMEAAGRIWPRYKMAGAPKEKIVRELVREALERPESINLCTHAVCSHTLFAVPQILQLVKTAAGLDYISVDDFWGCLHLPRTLAEGECSLRAARVLAVKGIKHNADILNDRAVHPNAPIAIDANILNRLIASQPEVLTADQRNAVLGIAEAFRSPKPLTGLLSGDVGSGKSLTYLLPALAAQQAQARVAIISPTEILANQLYQTITTRFPTVAAERVRTGKKIKNPNAVLIGTSGLATVAKKQDYQPNVLIVDEQHKMAASTRTAMLWPWTHLIEASATPIPRSLATSLFSSMQVFTLSSSPVKRDIQSVVGDEGQRSAVSGWMREALQQGGRVAIVYPRVQMVVATDDEDEGVDVGASLADFMGSKGILQEKERPVAEVVGSVLSAAEKLKVAFPGRVGVLHGKLSSEELTDSLDRFKSGATPIVVASTVIETGIDVPDIRLLIVRGAENFGVAQLHQLRGRLARNGGSAKFVMMVDDIANLSPETLDRLNSVAMNTNGFKLAEIDLIQRGMGDLAGQAQSGESPNAFRMLRLNLGDFISAV
jgi:ATP-dependent DNA helicase RecG